MRPIDRRTPQPISPLDNYRPSLEQKNRLGLLKRVVEILENRGVEYAVLGGYGLDGLYGKLTRDHNDFDLVIGKGIEKIAGLLKELGFEKESTKPSGLEVYFHAPTDTKLEFAYLDLPLMSELFDEKRELVEQVTAGSLPGLVFKVPVLELQKSVRNIQQKRLGSAGPHVEHDEMIIKTLEART